MRSGVSATAGGGFSMFRAADEQHLFIKLGTVASGLVSDSGAVIVDCRYRITQEFGYAVAVGDSEPYQGEDAKLGRSEERRVGKECRL